MICFVLVFLFSPKHSELLLLIQIINLLLGMGNFLKWKDFHLLLKNRDRDNKSGRVGKRSDPVLEHLLFSPPSSWSPHCSHTGLTVPPIHQAQSDLRDFILAGMLVPGCPHGAPRPLQTDLWQTSAQCQHLTEDVHCPSIQNNPPSPTRLPSTSMTLLSTWHTICLLVYLFLFSLMRRSTPSRQGLSQFCSLLHLQLLEQCLTQNKCSINNVCFLNERMKVTFHKRLHSIKISANAPGECLFPFILTNTGCWR